MQQKYIIIVAGGIGSRMNNTQPKQFIDINGEPIIIKTINRFLEYNASIHIIISVHKDYQAHLESLISEFKLKDKSIKLTIGGDTRFASVKNGLKLIEDDNAIVAIHDAARPFVSLKTIASCFETAVEKGNAIPCVCVSESMRRVNNDKNHAVNRSEYKIVQTPQCFLVSLIKKAFEQDYNFSFTDDATVLEATGEKINLVEGNDENIKITTPNDLILARALLTL